MTAPPPIDHTTPQGGTLHVARQGRSSHILIGPADFPPLMGEVWFLGFGGLSLRPEGPKIEVLSARPEGPRAGVGLFFPPAKGLR